MGGFFSSVWNKLFNTNRTYNILILGLANAGKTTLLYQMSLGKAVETTPTIGSNVEEITHKNVKLSAWDLGGQERVRSIWSTYYTRTDAVIFVIDSTDMKGEVIAKTELFKVVINEVLPTLFRPLRMCLFSSWPTSKTPREL
jgi:small GTP-binding protein